MHSQDTYGDYKMDENKLSATDLLTSKAKWTAACIQPYLEDKSREACSKLFHLLREHYALTAVELLLAVEVDDSTTRKSSLPMTTLHDELLQLRKWKEDQIHLDDLLNRGNKKRVIKTDRGDYYDA